MNLGTLLYTWFKGELVGTDEFENRYYRAGSGHRYGRERRWLLYKGKSEASRIPPDWHAWLHHTTDAPLTENAAVAPGWQRPHTANASGTPAAYRPAGHDLMGGARAPASSDYVAWSPEGDDGGDDDGDGVRDSN